MSRQRRASALLLMSRLISLSTPLVTAALRAGFVVPLWSRLSPPMLCGVSISITIPSAPVIEPTSRKICWIVLRQVFERAFRTPYRVRQGMRRRSRRALSLAAPEVAASIFAPLCRRALAKRARLGCSSPHTRIYTGTDAVRTYCEAERETVCPALHWRSGLLMGWSARV